MHLDNGNYFCQVFSTPQNKSSIYSWARPHIEGAPMSVWYFLHVCFRLRGGGGNTCLFQFVHVTSISRKKVLKSVYENLKFVGWFSKSSICSKLGKIKNNIAFSVFILQYATTQTNNKSCFKSFYAD